MEGAAKTKLPYPEYIRKEIEQICSPLNRWGTGLVVKHDPSDNELAEHFIECGAADRFQGQFEFIPTNAATEREGTEIPPAQ
jgi:hypothetical protein